MLNNKLNTNRSLKKVLGSTYLFCADTATLFQFAGSPNHVNSVTVPDSFSRDAKRSQFLYSSKYVAEVGGHLNRVVGKNPVD